MRRKLALPAVGQVTIKALRGRQTHPRQSQDQVDVDGQAQPCRRRKPAPVPPGPEVTEAWQRYLRGLWLSGLRLGESLNLYWDRDDRLRIDLTDEFPMLWIPGELQKSGEDELLPITPDFSEFLLATPEAERTGRVFKLPCQRGEERGLDDQYVSAVVAAIGKAAGVKVFTHPKTGKVKYASAHDLRRSFGNRWAPRVTPVMLQQLMRHADIQTTLRYYVNLKAQDTARMLWNLDGGRQAESRGKTGQRGTILGTTGDSHDKSAAVVEDVSFDS